MFRPLPQLPSRDLPLHHLATRLGCGGVALGGPYVRRTLTYHPLPPERQAQQKPQALF